MRALTHADFLSLWEKGRGLHPLDQGLLAIHAAFPEARETVADWPLGQRNRALAEKRLAEIVRRALVVTKPRKKTKPTRSAVERRLAAKKLRSKIKHDRHDPPTDE